MTLFFLLHTPNTIPFTKLTTISCTSSKPPYKRPHNQQQVPEARDRVIDFGRHKGKPLGSLPSTYLEWVSRNLRAGDSLHWAELANRVLRDPVYKDRIEWEMAENLLSGDGIRNRGEGSESVVSRLVEVSERFGWDNEDKLGWSRVDFGLLGTSYGGRIPRKVEESKMGNGEMEMVVVEEEERGLVEESEERRRERRLRRVRGKMGIRDSGRGSFGIGGKSGGDGDLTVENGEGSFGNVQKGKERRVNMVRDKTGIRDGGRGSFGIGGRSGDGDRTVEIGERRLGVSREKLGIRDDGEGSLGNVNESEGRRMSVVGGKMGIRDSITGSFGIGGKSGDEDRTVEINGEERRGMRMVREKMGIRDNVKGSFGNGKKSSDDDVDQDRTVEIKNPFPGREALLKKVLRSRRFV